MDNYQSYPQNEEIDRASNLERPSFYGRMKDRAKNTAYSMGRGVKSVGSYAYNQIPRRNDNFNVFTQSGNNRSVTDFASGTNSFQRRQAAIGALGTAASGIYSMFKGHGGRTQKRKRKLRKVKTNKSKKRRITRKRI